MALATVEDYIDYLADRVGKNDATARARFLDWLQEAETTLWIRRPWWFKQDIHALALVSGTADYVLSAPTEYVYQVRCNGGAALSFVDPATFNVLFAPDATAGTPVHWTQLPNPGQAKIGLWPVPSATGTADVVVDKAARTLVDNEASYSQLPVDDRLLILKGALVSAAKHYRWTAELPLLVSNYDQALAYLELRDQEHPRMERI